MRKCVGPNLDFVAKGYHKAFFCLDLVRILFVFKNPFGHLSKYVDVSYRQVELVVVDSPLAEALCPFAGVRVTSVPVAVGAQVV
jgi:hypothetical protein